MYNNHWLFILNRLRGYFLDVTVNKIGFAFLSFLLCQFLGYTSLKGQPNPNGKTAVVLVVLLDDHNPGLQDQELLIPLYEKFKHEFRLSQIYMAKNGKVQWGAEIGDIFTSFKKLSTDDMEKVNEMHADYYIKLKVWSEFNDLLGGLVPNTTKHMLKAKCAVYDRDGNNIWWVKKKYNSAISSASSEEQDNLSYEPEEYLTAYKRLLEQFFSSNRKAKAQTL